MRSTSPWNYWVIPCILYYSLFFLTPYIAFASNSLRVFEGPGRVSSTLTIENYKKIFFDTVYVLGLWDTFFASIITVLITLILSLPIAILLAKSRSRYINLVYTLIFISAMTSTVIKSMGILSFLGAEGPLNKLLKFLGIIEEPLKLTNNLTGAIIALIHYYIPFMIMLITPVIQSVSSTLEEAAMGLGASRITTLYKITLPLASPGILGASLLSFATTLGAYTSTAIVGGPRLKVFPILIYQQIHTVQNYALGSALAFTLMLLAFIVVITTNSLLKGRLVRL